jgi:hypothetical protein
MKYCFDSDHESDLKAALEKLFAKLGQQCDKSLEMNQSTVRDNMRLTSTDIVSFKSAMNPGKVAL